MTGEQLLAEVVAMLESEYRSCRWFHSYDPLRDRQRGLPDLIIVGRGGVLFRECKGVGESLRPDQTVWMHALLSARADWAIWYPGYLRSGRIEEELRSIA